MSQHGFRKSFSCETQLLCFTHSLHAILDRGSRVDCIFLDFSKAFDKINHHLLLYKLRTLNIDDGILTWIEFFLTNRSQYVIANNYCSPSSPVTSGVPQGSVLGPLLFLIYINDLPDVVTSSIHLFADDCVVYREISSNFDTSSLQTDITNIASWCTTWRMDLNTNKCKVLRISRTTQPPANYTLNNVTLDTVTSYKYLGIHISSDLSWNHHINYVINNSNRTLGYLRRNFSRAPQAVKLTMYKTLVRPKLEYACSIWDPFQLNLTHSLEMVQNNAARFILSNYHRTSSVTSMKRTLSLQSLESRRKASRLILFHKIFNHPFLKPQFVTTPSYRSARLDHQHKVHVISCRTITFYHSFVPRTSSDWNHLPFDIVSISNHALFSSTVQNYLLDDA